MNKINIAGEPTELITNMALLGLASIIEEQLKTKTKIGWEEKNSLITGYISTQKTTQEIIEAVHAHANKHSSQQNTWLCKKAPDGENGMVTSIPEKRMSSKIIEELINARLEVEKSDKTSMLDKKMIFALGEICWWNKNEEKAISQRYGASSWDMVSRNGGNNAIKHLTKIASKLAQREPQKIETGLTQRGNIIDELAKGQESRSSAGLNGTRKTDLAIAWCALWGINLFPTMHKAATKQSKSSLKSACFYKNKGKRTIFLPLFIEQETTINHFKNTIISKDFHLVSNKKGEDKNIKWLEEQGVTGLLEIPIVSDPNLNTAEFIAEQGKLVLIQELRVGGV